MGAESRAPAAVAWDLLGGVALAKLALHLLANGLLSYGYMNDELYFLDSIDRLAWGYVDHPPLPVAVLAGWTATFGDSLFSIRIVPAALGGVLVLLTGAMARELGGGRVAQGLAALSALVAPVFLSQHSAYQIAAFDLAFWALAVFLLLRIQNGARPVTWLALGAVLGVALLGKWSPLWLGAGLGVGLLATPERRWLATPWPWLAGAVALAIFSPHLAWQVQHGWPTLEFLRNAVEHKHVQTTPLSFAWGQIMTLAPPLAPLWMGGLLTLLAAREMRPYRLVAWIWITVLGLLMASGAARSYYAAPAYPVLLAAGAHALEAFAASRGWRWLPAAAASWLVLAGGFAAPFAMPLLPPSGYVAYRSLLPLSLPKQRVDDTGPIPSHIAPRLEARPVFEAILGVYQSLSPAERERVGIFTTDFSQAGAINLWGREAGLPRAIGGRNSYWLWGPGDTSGELMIVVWPRDRDLGWWFEEVEHVADFECRYCMGELLRHSVYLGRRPRRPLDEIWPELKIYL